MPLKSMHWNLALVIMDSESPTQDNHLFIRPQSGKFCALGDRLASPGPPPNAPKGQNGYFTEMRMPHMF